MKARAWVEHVPLLATLVMLTALYSFCALRHPPFLTWAMARNLLLGNAVLGMVGVGMAFVILSGGIDLSVGAVIGFVSILIAVLVERGWHPLIAGASALVLGTSAGAAMGGLIHVFRLPPFLATLAGMFLFRGVALMISERSIAIRHPLYHWLGTLGAGPCPPVAALFLALAGAAWVIARRLPFGRYAYAVGHHEESARLMGVPVGRTKVGVHAWSGFCAALAGAASTVAMGAGHAGAGHLYELDAIAVVVIGGISLSGGSGSILGVVCGVLIFGLIQELLPFLGVDNSWWARMAAGALLLTFILLQRLLQTRVTRTLNR